MVNYNLMWGYYIVCLVVKGNKESIKAYYSSLALHVHLACFYTGVYSVSLIKKIR